MREKQNRIKFVPESPEESQKALRPIVKFDSQSILKPTVYPVPKLHELLPRTHDAADAADASAEMRAGRDWGRVENFLKTSIKGQVSLDIACGKGHLAKKLVIG